MKQNSENNPRETGINPQATENRSEMEGLIGLGMKRDALKLARHHLKNDSMNARMLDDALNAILTLADKTRPWAKAIETAYERLPKRERAAVRFLMMAFRNACHDHEGVLRLMPKRFAGEFAFRELIYTFEAAFELNDTELMEKLADRLPRAVSEADHPLTQSKLFLCLAEYLARKGSWGDALAALQEAQTNETFSRDAVAAIVEIHVACALAALRQGFELIDQFKQNFDPVAETIVPGNDNAIQEQAAKKFRRLQKTLEKIVPEKRQRALGLLAE